MRIFCIESLKIIFGGFMPFKGAIFDLDGVIVDTVPLHFEGWRYLFSDIHHIPFTRQDYDDKVDGKPRIDGVRAIMPNLTLEEAIKEGEIKQQKYLELIAAGKMQEFPTSFALIKELKAKGIKLAAASSSKNAVFILEKVKLLQDFDVVVSGNDFTHGKPAPDIFLVAAKKLNLEVKDCIVFEDALAGVQAAKAGKFICVGINRHNKAENYKEADLVVTDLGEVNFEILSKLIK